MEIVWDGQSVVHARGVTGKDDQSVGDTETTGGSDNGVGSLE